MGSTRNLMLDGNVGARARAQEAINSPLYSVVVCIKKCSGIQRQRAFD